MSHKHKGSNLREFNVVRLGNYFVKSDDPARISAEGGLHFIRRLD